MRAPSTRRTALTTRALALAIVATSSLIGCGDSSSGDGVGSVTGNAAIDATVSASALSLLTGTQNINASVTSGTVSNPYPAQANASAATALGAGTTDGTASNVTVSINGQRNPDGSGFVQVFVTEAGSGGFVYLEAFATLNAPSVSLRVPPRGLSGLATDGTGQAFVIARINQSGTVRRIFENQSTSGETLIDVSGLTPIPARDISAVFTGYQDVLFGYRITLDTNGNPVAQIEHAEAAGSGFALGRDNGPAVVSLNQRYTGLSIGGVAHDASLDVVAVVGNDANGPGVAPVASDSAVSFQLNLDGGVSGGELDSDVLGSLAAPLTNQTASGFSFSSAMAFLDLVDDGLIQIDRQVRIRSESAEDPTTVGDVSHSVDGALSAINLEGLDDLEDLLYLPGYSSRATPLLLFR